MRKEMPRRKKRLLYKIYAVVIILLAVLIICLAVMMLFHTRNVAIEGLEYSSPDAVEEWLRVDQGSVNTLYLLGKYRLGNAELMPFMEGMKVSLKNPWTVRLQITEKKMIGYIQTEQGNVCFDKEGMVIYISSVPVEGIPLIEGMDIQKSELYEILEVKDEKVFQRILDTTQMLKKCSLTADRILSDGKNVTLYFGGICAEIGSSDLKNKILQLPEILEKLTGQEGTLKMQHFTASSKYISFQKTQPASEENPEGNPDSIDPDSGEEQENEEGAEEGENSENQDEEGSYENGSSYENENEEEE